MRDVLHRQASGCVVFKVGVLPKKLVYEPTQYSRCFVSSLILVAAEEEQECSIFRSNILNHHFGNVQSKHGLAFAWPTCDPKRT